MGFSTGPKELHVDKLLTQLAINYRPQGFIGDQIAPIVPVSKQRDAYPVFSRDEAFAIEDDKRAPGGLAKIISQSVGSSFYQAEDHALAKEVTIEDTVNMDDAFRAQLQTGAANYLQGKLMLGWEKRVLTLAANTTSVSSVWVCSSVWGGSGIVPANTGDPYSMIENLREAHKQRTGTGFNSVIMGWRAWSRFKRNVNIRNLVNGTNNGRGPVTRQQVQDLLEVDRFLISDAMYHTANEGYQGMTNISSFSNAVQDMFIAYYAPLAPSINDPSWMYTFRWTNPALPAPLTVFRHPYDSKTRSEKIEVDFYQDERITGSDYASILLTNVASGAAGLS
jgi:hypothetical protein